MIVFAQADRQEQAWQGYEQLLVLTEQLTASLDHLQEKSQYQHG